MNLYAGACLNADGVLDTTMISPLVQMMNAMGQQVWGYSSWVGNPTVSRQHQVILNEPLMTPQDYFCWDYTTQAACANFTPSDENAFPGKVYTIVQDPWIDTCFWSNADDRKIGVWDTSHTGGFATSGGECVVTAVVPTATLTYDPQGGTGEPGDQTGDAASDVTVSTTAPTRSGYTFTGWNTAADGSGTSYAGNDSYTLPNSGTDTLYAQWTENTSTIAYDANGGTGDPADQTCTSGSVTLSSTVPTRSGYTFVNWSYMSAGVANVANPGDSVTCDDLTLTAQWSLDTTSGPWDCTTSDANGQTVGVGYVVTHPESYPYHAYVRQGVRDPSTGTWTFSLIATRDMGGLGFRTGGLMMDGSGHMYGHRGKPVTCLLYTSPSPRD